MYTPTVYKDGEAPARDAVHLNKTENALKDVHDTADSNKSRLDTLEPKVDDNTAAIAGLSSGLVNKGKFTPVLGAEYPASGTNWFYTIANLTSDGYTFTTGALNGQTAHNLDQIQYVGGTWVLFEVNATVSIENGAIGNINSPLTLLDLTTAQNVKNSFSGEFRYECSTPTTHKDIFGKMVTNAVYSGTATGGSYWNLTDSGATWTAGELEDYVVKITTGSIIEYRWVIGNDSTNIVLDKPVSTTIVGASTTYALAKPRFEKKGILIEGPSTNYQVYSNDFTQANWIKTNCTAPKSVVKLGLDGLTYMSELTTTSTGLATLLYDQYDPTGWLTGQLVTETWRVARGTANRRINIVMNNGKQGGGAGGIIINLDDFSISNNTTVSYRVEHIRNDIYEIETTFYYDNTAGQQNNIHLYFAKNDATNPDAGDFCYIEKAQFEKLPFGSSYIDTLAAPVLRGADYVSIPYKNNFGGFANPFTILTKFSTLSDAYAGNNRFVLTSGFTANGYVNVTTTGGVSFTALNGNICSNASNKDEKTLTCVSDGVNLKEAINGVIQVDTGTVGVAVETPFETLYIGSGNGTSGFLFGNIKYIKLYNKVLSDSELAIA